MIDPRPAEGQGNGLFALAVAAFVVMGLAFLPAFEYRINTDATAYVSIARHYLAGGFAQAINGYWGPLFSLLLAPVLATGLPPLVAARLVELAAGLATLFAVRRLALGLGASRASTGVLALCLVVPLVSYSIILVTPDILLLFLLVMYCGFVLPEQCRRHRLYGAGAGLFAGLAYLAKSYALPFFLAHFFLINLLHFYRAGSDAEAGVRRRQVLVHYALGLLVFVLVVGPWVGLLSHKYGTLTFGTAGQRAYCMVGPEYIGDDPVFEMLIPPPSASAISYWDDPTVVKMHPWRPWQSRALLQHQLKLIGTNMWAMVCQITTLIPFAVATLLCFVGLLITGFMRKPSGPEPAPSRLLATVTAPLLLTLAVFAGGYMPMFVEIRYLWLAVVLLILMTVLVLQSFAMAYRFRQGVWSFLAVWMVLTCALPPLNELVAKSHQGKDYFAMARKLSDGYGVSGNLASNERWDMSLFAAFHMGARYFGRVPEELADDEDRLVAALQEHGIDFYLVWGREDRIAKGPFTKNPLPEITGGQTKGLRVYAIPTPPMNTRP